mgnify:CR=1 FL=1
MEHVACQYVAGIWRRHNVVGAEFLFFWTCACNWCCKWHEWWCQFLWDSASEDLERRALLDGERNAVDLVATSDLGNKECFRHRKSQRNKFFKMWTQMQWKLWRTQHSPYISVHGCMTMFWLEPEARASDSSERRRLRSGPSQVACYVSFVESFARLSFRSFCICLWVELDDFFWAWISFELIWFTCHCWWANWWEFLASFVISLRFHYFASKWLHVSCYAWWLAPCDLGDPGWGDPWFPHGAFVASLTFWYGLVILMFFPLFLLPYHVKMIQCYHSCIN